jgi:hypothetical protein
MNPSHKEVSKELRSISDICVKAMTDAAGKPDVIRYLSGIRGVIEARIESLEYFGQIAKEN